MWDKLGMFFIRFLAFHAMLLYNKISIFKTLLEFRGFRISLVNLFLFETHPHGQMENIHSFQQLVPVVDLPLPSLSPPPDVNTFFSNFTKSDPFFFNSLFNIDLTFFYLEKYIWHITLFQKGLANS